MSRTPDCVDCGHPSRYHGGGERPWPCDVKDCSCRDFRRPDEVTPAPPDLVEHPPHYSSHPSGVECITVTRHMTFNLGNAVKYVWRAGEKGDEIEDLRKARWYLADEIKRLGGEP